MKKRHFFHKRTPADSSYETPAWLYDALDREFHFTHDLAAVAENAKTKFFQDALKVPWHALDGWLFLNPPFAGIRQWIERAAAEAKLGARIVVLVPVTVLGAPYMRECHPKTIRLVSRCPTFKGTFSGKIIRFFPALLIYGNGTTRRSFTYQRLPETYGKENG